MPEVLFVTSRAFALDGIGYSCSVYRNHDRFLGVWICHVCNKHEMLPLLQQSELEALDSCDELIRNHHLESHAVGPCD